MIRRTFSGASVSTTALRSVNEMSEIVTVYSCCPSFEKTQASFSCLEMVFSGSGISDRGLPYHLQGRDRCDPAAARKYRCKVDIPDYSEAGARECISF